MQLILLIYQTNASYRVRAHLTLEKFGQIIIFALWLIHKNLKAILWINIWQNHILFNINFMLVCMYFWIKLPFFTFYNFHVTWVRSKNRSIRVKNNGKKTVKRTCLRRPKSEGASMREQTGSRTLKWRTSCEDGGCVNCAAWYQTWLLMLSQSQFMS